MTKIYPNLGGGGLDNGYKIYELFLNRFFSIIKIFFRNHKIIKKNLEAYFY